MKKIEYKAPAMEIIKLNVQRTVLSVVSGAGSTAGFGGDGDDVPNP